MTEDYVKAFGMDGKVCAVTGGAGGIGSAIVAAFVQEGAKVAVLDRGADLPDSVAGVASGMARAFACDISDSSTIAEAEQEIRSTLGPVDILVNCAAIQSRGALADLSDEAWDAAININLRGAFLCSRVFGNQMRARGSGVIVHVSSVQAHYPSPQAGAYSPAKSGLSLLSKQIALEWGPDGVRSNTVMPAWVITPMSRPMYERPGFTEARESMVPLGRIGRPEDTAQAVLFLASDRASYITGTDLMIDGGLTCNLMGGLQR